MRTIKFRAWDIARKEWVKPTLSFNIAIDLEGEIYELDSEPYASSSSNYILMQSIELKDRNGKEIYEGDIVEFENDIGNGPFRDKGVVEYEPMYGAYQLIGGDLTNRKSGSVLWAFQDEINSKPIILGNFYENSELLVDSHE